MSTVNHDVISKAIKIADRLRTGSASNFNVDNFMESMGILNKQRKRDDRYKAVLKKYGPIPSLREAGRTRTMHPGLPHSKGWMRNLACPCDSGKKFKHCHM